MNIGFHRLLHGQFVVVTNNSLPVGNELSYTLSNRLLHETLESKNYLYLLFEWEFEIKNAGGDIIATFSLNDYYEVFNKSVSADELIIIVQESISKSNSLLFSRCTMSNIEPVKIEMTDNDVNGLASDLVWRIQTYAIQ